MAKLFTRTETGFIITIPGHPTIIFDVEKAASTTGRDAMFHGYKQKISDTMAMSRDPITGQSASPANKYAALLEMARALESGEPWNRGRQTRTTSALAFTEAQILDAIRIVRGFAFTDDARAWVKRVAVQHSLEYAAALSTMVGAAAIMTQLVKTHTNTSGLDADALIAGMDDAADDDADNGTSDIDAA